MSIVSAKCTCCGADITVDDSKEALICEHCNSAFIVEKAVELFNNEKETAGFEISDGVLKKYNGESEDIVIPGGVKKIGKGAFFKNLTLKSVVIPEGVTDIEDYAFAYCDLLSKVTCPGCEEDGDCVVFPESLQYLGDHCFRECFSLPANIVFKNRNRLYHDGNPVFRHCFDNKAEITIMQKGHKTPRMYSKLGTFDMELTPLSNYLFGNDFPKEKVKLKDGRDKEETERQENEERRFHSPSPSKSGEHRMHRSEIWRQSGLCAHCGGSFNMFKKCKSCGMKKDY